MDDEATSSDDEGFWSFVRRTRPMSFSEETEERIDKRQKRVCTKKFGISYEWITEPHEWRSGHGGQYFFSTTDGLFQGVPKDDFDEIIGKIPDGKATFLAPEDAVYSDRPYRDINGETLIPDHLFSSSNLPRAKDMEGEYDIIFYAGEASQYLGKHHRTARGTVNLSCNSSGQIIGNVTMHPCMEDIDVIPFGGNYSFVEKSRVQRKGKGDYDFFPGDATLPTGVINIEVTDRPYGLCVNDGYDLRNLAPALKHMAPFGELRIFREKVGAGITNQIPGGAWDNNTYNSLVPFRNSEEAETLNTSHYRRTCSWLHRHTILDEASSVHVGRFLCPPPVLFFEEGDIQLDINWKRVAPGCYNACSSIIARRRTLGVANEHDLLTSDDRKFRVEMSSVQLEIDKLEGKKDMIWLAYECAKMLREDDNCDNPALVKFSVHDEKVRRCIMYMDEVVFNEQLSLYGLHLESMRFVANTEYSTREFTLSRTR
jgi:hypothetical protein